VGFTHNCVGSSSAPSKRVKRKSLGFMELKESIGIRRDNLENLAVGEAPCVSGSPRKGPYMSIWLGHVVGQGDRDMSEQESGSQQGEVQTATRSRRKSHSRFLLDRDQENESNGSSQGAVRERERWLSRFSGFHPTDIFGWCW